MAYLPAQYRTNSAYCSTWDENIRSRHDVHSAAAAGDDGNAPPGAAELWNFAGRCLSAALSSSNSAGNARRGLRTSTTAPDTSASQSTNLPDLCGYRV